MKTLLKRTVDGIGLAAGLFFLALGAIFIFSKGRLLSKPIWTHILGVTGAVWIISIVLMGIMEMAESLASRRAAGINRWDEAVPWHDRKRRGRIGVVLSSVSFVVALVLGVASFHRYQPETCLMLVSGVVLLAYSSVLLAIQNLSNGPES